LLQATTAATYHCTSFLAKDFNPNSLFATFRTREKSRQTLLGNANNFSPSSPHPRILLYAENLGYTSIFTFALKYLPTPINNEDAQNLNLSPSFLNLDWSDVEAKTTHFIQDYVEQSRAKGVVLGLSGGIDSCTVAALSALAIGGKKVLGLMLPEKETCEAKDIEHAKLVAKKFSIEAQQIDITPTLNAFYASTPDFDPTDYLCKGNIKARTRMIYLYYYANKFNMIVCGSSDKSETMMGYFTKWGDVAADISPIMDLYKTQVRALAEHMKIPRAIIRKPSSPALWPGQLAEDELGIEYEMLDLILYGLEHFMNTAEIAKQLRVKERLVERTKQRWLSAEHKRRMLLTMKLGYRTIGTDFRLLRNP
jgi:NAD+ synthase